MQFKNYIRIIKADLYRNLRAKSFIDFIKVYRHKPGFRYVFWMRTAIYFSESPILKYFMRIVLFKLSRLGVRYGISVPYMTRIGPGFCITHYGGIVVNGTTIFGRNCNLSHGVTIGQKNRGKYKGCPTIGDMVYIGPGSCILGGISIGSNVAIGANAVVVHNVGDDEVVAGNPARTISKKGSKDYVICILNEDGTESEISDYERFRGQLSAWWKS